MASVNPIIWKEFLQASHHRRTYWLRTGIPIAGILVVVPQIVVRIAMGGSDWRVVAELTRPMFLTLSWMGMILFSLLGALYTHAALREELTHRTLGILLTTSLSVTRIVYGKFIASIGKLLVAALALLPVAVLTSRMGRMPTRLVLHTLGLVVASIVLFAALALVDSCAPLRRSKKGGWAADLVVLYFVGAMAAGLLLAPTIPILIALVPPWAFYFVVTGTGPGGMSAGSFAAAGILVPLAIGGMLLCLAPVAFSRAVSRQLGGSISSPRRGSKWRGRHRQALGDNANPFTWQEMGPASRRVRTVIVFLYLICAVTGIGSQYWMSQGGMLGAGVPNIAWMLLVQLNGLMVMVFLLVIIGYGASMFGREKSRRTAELLILTGNPPGVFLMGKLKAFFRILKVPMIAAAAGFCLVVFWAVFIFGVRGVESELFPGLLIGVVRSLIVLPFTLGLVGIVFGAAAKSTTEGVAAVVVSYVIAYFVSGVAGVVFGLGLVALGFGMGSSSWSYVRPILLVLGIIALAASRWLRPALSKALSRLAGRVRSVWHLSLIHAVLTGVGWIVGLGFAALRGFGAGVGSLYYGLQLLVSIGIIVFWYYLGKWTFERGMLSERS